jgi:DNA primase
VAALEQAEDALEFKLRQVLPPGAPQGLEERAAGMEAVLRIIALAGNMPGPTGAIKRELMISRIARRLALKDETVWARLRELESTPAGRPARVKDEAAATPRAAPAPPEERELLTVLLGDPGLVPSAASDIRPEDLQHPGLRRLLEALYSLSTEGKPPTLDNLRGLVDEPRLIAKALEWQEVGQAHSNRPAWLRAIVQEFRRKRQIAPRVEELKNQLHADINHETALDLFRRLQNPNPN